jgi:hypothetical protein
MHRKNKIGNVSQQFDPKLRNIARLLDDNNYPSDAVFPPSTLSIVPVTQFASSDAR